MRLALLCPIVVATSCSLVRNLDDLEGGTTSTTSTGGTGGSPTTGGTDPGGRGGEGAAMPGTGGFGACLGFAPGGYGGEGGGPVAGSETVGCSDATRELFLDEATHPEIAGCSGGFSIPGTIGLASLTAACNRQGGNDGNRPNGEGCSVEDLRAVGWHVCLDASEVAAKSGTGQCVDDGVGFFSSRQSQNDATSCVVNGRNNLVGCGSGIGDVADAASCAPLTVELREVHCDDSCAWLCDDPQLFNEAEVVQKLSDEDGGVLCCKDGT